MLRSDELATVQSQPLSVPGHSKMNGFVPSGQLATPAAVMVTSVIGDSCLKVKDQLTNY